MTAVATPDPALSRKPTRQVFPDFAGVTLADILANGTAILILMIVLTLQTANEEREKQWEQVEEVNVLLSRDLATSVVMNDLPSSPPAVLHDYATSPLDQNLNELVTPILELWPDHVRNYYTGQVISRDELLVPDNPLDLYVRSFSAIQRVRIRMDLYDIRMFYIVMSILKDNGVTPYHWHFMTKEAAQRRGSRTGSSGDGEGFSGFGKPKARNLESFGDEGLTEGGPLQSPFNSELGGLAPDSSLELGTPGLPNYPYDDLAFDQRGGGEPNGKSGQPGSSGAPSVQFRSARPVPRQGGLPLQSDATSDLFVLLKALFKYMRNVQEDVDAGGSSELYRYDFLRDIIPLVEEIRQSELDAEETEEIEEIDDAETDIIDALVYFLSEELYKPERPLMKEQKIKPEVRSQVLSIPANEPLSTIYIVGNEHQDKLEDINEIKGLDLNVSLFPAIYEGLRIPIKRGAIVMVPPQQENPSEYRWRVVTIVNPERNDYLTALVHAAYDEESGELFLSTGQNSVNLVGRRVTTNYPIVEFKSEKWFLLLYGLPTLLLLLGLIWGATIRQSRRAAVVGRRSLVS